jgi:glycosyltransferase involved in cell wall biosynthesis
MRVALVHDWLTGMRGGERVLERLCRLFPDATVHTLVWRRGSVSAAIESHPIETSLVDRLPAADRLYRWYLPTFPAAIESLRLPRVEAVISTSHCVAKGVRAPDGAFHLSYVFTPMRYVWELEDEYFPPGRYPWPASSAIRMACARLRCWDRRSAARPDALVAISRHVARRIRDHWEREAQVLAPPVSVARFQPAAARADYYLVAGAFAPYKRADLAIQACRALGRRLVVVGTGQEARRLERLAGPGVEFRGWVEDDEMASLYAAARGLLFPGEEDFGIVPVEAMASGCPVIAYGRGGALETVGAGAAAGTLAQVAAGRAAVAPGGVLFGEPTAAALADAIRLAESTAFDPHALRARALPFDDAAFDRAFENAFRAAYEAWRNGVEATTSR